MSTLCEGKVYPHRWVYVSRSLRRDNNVEDINRIVKTASEHGLNGMVLAAGLDRLDLQPKDYFRRLEEVKRISKEHNVEIIPIIFSAGYGGAVLGHDRNLAAGIPVKDALFVVKDGRATLVPDPPVEVANGGFEEYDGNNLKEYRFHDRPGDVSFVDEEVFKNGKASLRFENFGRYEHGHARVMQEVKVQPHRCYRLSCWVKTERLEPEGSFRIQVLTSEGRNLAPWQPRISSTNDWQKVVMGFNSLDYDKVRIYVGAWGGRSGKFWVDDLEIEEVGLLNVLRRPGTPVTVKNKETGMVYLAG